MSEFGFLLRLAREKRGLTQTQVMQYTGINNKTLSGYENGISEPVLDTLAALLRLYGASADRLLGLGPSAGGAQTAQEAEVLRLFRRLPQEGQAGCLALLHSLSHRGRPKGEP